MLTVILSLGVWRIMILPRCSMVRRERIYRRGGLCRGINKGNIGGITWGKLA